MGIAWQPSEGKVQLPEAVLNMILVLPQADESKPRKEQWGNSNPYSWEGLQPLPKNPVHGQ